MVGLNGQEFSKLVVDLPAEPVPVMSPRDECYYLITKDTPVKSRALDQLGEATFFRLGGALYLLAQ